MHVLVTGASGTVGRVLVPALVDSGIEVTAISRRTCSLPGATILECDLARSIPTPEVGYDAIVHLAAAVRGPEGPERMTDNVYATYNVLNIAARSKVERVIYASTCGVYGYPNQAAVDEHSSIRPNSYYALTKYLGERVLDAFPARSLILRFTYLYGPTDHDGSIFRLVSQIKNCTEIQVKDEKRDYLFIDDAVQAIVLALNYKGPERIFNVGTGRLTSLLSIAEAASQILGKSGTIYMLPGRRNPAIDAGLAEKELQWRPIINEDKAIEVTINALAGLSLPDS